MKYKQYKINSDQRQWEFYAKRYEDSKAGIERLKTDKREDSLLFKHYEKNLEDCILRYPCLNK